MARTILSLLLGGFGYHWCVVQRHGPEQVVPDCTLAACVCCCFTVLRVFVEQLLHGGAVMTLTPGHCRQTRNNCA